MSTGVSMCGRICFLNSLARFLTSTIKRAILRPPAVEPVHPLMNIRSRAMNQKNGCQAVISAVNKPVLEPNETHWNTDLRKVSSIEE